MASTERHRRAQARPGRVVVHYAVVQTSLGRVCVAATRRGVVRVALGVREDVFGAALRRLPGVDVVRRRPCGRLDVLARAVAQIRAYASRRRWCLDVPVDLRGRGGFDLRVLRATAALAPGETVSYGEIARRIRAPGASRAVGQALARNPVPLIIPCHRVVAAGGRLGGFSAGGQRRKAALLEHERAGLAAGTGDQRAGRR